MLKIKHLRTAIVAVVAACMITGCSSDKAFQDGAVAKAQETLEENNKSKIN